MNLPGVPYQPRHTSDEIVLGVVVAFVLHVLAVGPFIVKAFFPSAAGEEEKPFVARPVIQASLLKLGKPIDPKKLPDRFVPQARTAPKKQIVASREDPGPQKHDAGAPPPPNTEDSEIARLIQKSDPFAEDAGKARPEEGHAAGIDGGQETDPNKVKAGDMYAAQLGQFFGQHLSIPTISIGQASKLCAAFKIRLSRKMTIFYVNITPIIGSGNEVFDDATRTMLLKLRDDDSALPTPPKEVDEQYRGRELQIVVPGNPQGDFSRCNPK